MELTYIFLSALAILLIVNIILTFKAGKKESGKELTEIKKQSHEQHQIIRTKTSPNPLG